MQEEQEFRPWEQFEAILETGDSEALKQLIDQLPVSEIARSLSRLSPEDQQHVLKRLADRDAAEMIEQIPDPLAVDLLRAIPPEDAARERAQPLRPQIARAVGPAGGADVLQEGAAGDLGHDQPHLVERRP